jgi:hypothetical protein
LDALLEPVAIGRHGVKPSGREAWLEMISVPTAAGSDRTSPDEGLGCGE